MDRVNRIISHPLWREAVSEIEKLEEARAFCRHDFDHFISVARIAQMENIEKNSGISKEIIYSTALLHDIGRGMQYREGIPHDEASAVMAEKILDDCGFSKAERYEITEAILSHRSSRVSEFEDGADDIERPNLKTLIFRADKMSRNCFLCAAEAECNWSEEKKNKYLKK